LELVQLGVSGIDMPPPEPATSPTQIRQRFVDLLDEAKAVPLAGDRESHDGPNKRLAAAIRISPSRVGDFLDSRYSIPVLANRNQTGEPPKLLPDPRIRKTVAGFAASVCRTLSWFKEKKRLSDADTLTPELVVRAYWPRDVISEFNRESVADGISDARAVTDDEISRRQRIDIEIWVVSYGPFDKSGDGDHEDFFSAFGRALIAGIDPIDSVVSIKKKPLKELLNLPAPDRRHGRAIAMGPFATLYRRFRGYKFSTLPAIGIPLVGLLISDPRISYPHSQFTFRSIFDKHVDIKRIVVNNEIGHLTLLSMLPFEVRHDENIVSVLPGDDHRNIPDAILRDVLPNNSALFLSDAVLAFQIYSYLSKEELTINVISQWPPDERNYLSREFVFAPGIMVHDDDREFAVLINDSQQHIFKSHWRIENEFLEPLFRGLEGWLDTLRIQDHAIRHWPDHAPVFVFPRFDIDAYLSSVILHAGTRAHLLDRVCSWMDNRRNTSARKDALHKLFKISPAAILE
jgi:hypothetical protein